jgi:hypothetical protein
MDSLAICLDAKLRAWKSEIAEQVRQRVAEIIDSGRSYSSAPNTV